MIELKELCKTYDGKKCILKDVNVEIGKGEFVQIIGKSGSGKSTLLNLIGLLDNKYEGIIRINNIDVSKLSDIKVSQIRSKNIGFIFQAYNLINYMTALENIQLPFLYSQRSFTKNDMKRILDLVDEFGIKDIINTPIQYLSGGEKQRVSIVRSLVLEPGIILADEPTGNLDRDNGGLVFDVLKNMSKNGKTVVLVTHNWRDDLGADRILLLRDGVLK